MIDEHNISIAIRAMDAAVDALAHAPTTVLSAAGKDIKMQADLDAETAMLTMLRDASPLPILSEEAGADQAFSSAASGWVVDPLDGTANFARGIPMACSCLAMIDAGRPVLGVVHDHGANERWIGGPEVPTTMNGNAVNCSRAQDPGQAVLSTGFPRLFDFSHEALAERLEQWAAFKKVRMIGCAGLSLAWTAGGRMDLHMESGTFLWDVAAGLALVEGAGGRTRCTRPDKMWRCDVAAGALSLVDRYATRS
ncbi:MAG: inositol monophosphatase family protein [Phycisphaerales bacterium]|nr:inositol monophosphatase family protein [Phycisphaerales bacterium]